MSKFRGIIAVWLVLLVAVVVLNQASAKKQSVKIEFSVQSGTDGEVLRQLQKALHDGEYLSGLNILDKHHQYFTNLPTSADLQAFQFFYLKGHMHSALWQHIEAQQSWEFALKFAHSQQQQARLQRLLKAGNMLVNDTNDERQLSGVYRATPNTGPAAELKGKIVVVYVFLTDGAFQSWSLRERDFVMNSWAKAEHWLIRNAEKYNAKLSFSRRIFLVEKNPFISRLRVGDYDNQNEHANRVAELVANHFGAKDPLSFIERIKQEEKADQAILLFHLARSGRSFAQRCIHLCGTSGEYVYLMEAPSAKSGNFMSYAQTHETLHLFGADDLYNIRAAKNYVIRDIMNYPASILAANTLEPITAYAIGLRKQKPKAPFDIQVYSRKN